MSPRAIAKSAPEFFPVDGSTSSGAVVVRAAVVVVVRIATVVAEAVEFTPRVAELPTLQNTLQACAPLLSAIELAVEVMTVDAA